MDIKKPLTIDEQIELMKSRGCIIEIGTSFSKVYRNYLFDRKLRNMLSFIIEHIEISIKTKIAYFYSLKYGPLGYLLKENYNDKFNEEILNEN